MVLIITDPVIIIRWFSLFMQKCTFSPNILVWITNIVSAILWMIPISPWWTGENSPIFYQNQKNLEKYSHGTPRCLRKKLEIVVIRVNNQGDLMNSKPCNSCLYYMRLYGIKNVYYSDENGEIVKEKITDIEVEHDSIAHRNYKKYLETHKTK